MGEIMAAKHVDPLYLLDSTTLQRRDFALVSFKKLSERGGFKYFRIWGGAEPIDLCFEAAYPLFGFQVGVEAFAERLHTAPSHLCLQAPSEFPNCRRRDLQRSLSVIRRMSPKTGPRIIPAQQSHALTAIKNHRRFIIERLARASSV